MGVPVAVDCGGSMGSQLASHVRSVWEWCLRSDHAAPAATVRAVLDPSSAVVASASASGAVAHSDPLVMEDWLAPRITISAIEQMAGRALMLHACVLANPATGDAAILVGRSGAGKTTMARTLGTSLAYVTDETALVSEDHLVTPFPKPLSVFRSSDGGLKAQRPPSSLGLVAPPRRPIRAVAALLVDRREDAPASPVTSPVPTLEGLSQISEHTSYLKRLDSPLHRLAALFEACGGLQQVSYQESADLLPVVQSLVGAS